MGAGGLILLIVFGIAAAAVAGVNRANRYSSEVVATGLGTMIGAYFSNWFVRSVGAFGPEIDGLFLLPAVVGGVGFGAVAGLAAWDPEMPRR